MILRVHPETNAELMEALVWLIRRHRYEVAGRLNRLWLAGLDAIQANPQMYPMVDDSIGESEIRNFLLPRFGYRIVYEVTAGEVYVLSFARGRRRPGHWHNRVSHP